MASRLRMQFFVIYLSQIPNDSIDRSLDRAFSKAQTSRLYGRINFPASSNRTTTRIRSCDRGNGLNAPRKLPAGGSFPRKTTQKKRKIYEKTSLNCSGNRWIGD